MNKESIIKEIRNLMKFGEDKAENFLEVKSGDNIIRTEGEDFVVGEGVFVVTPEGLVPAPDGEHRLDDGRTILVSGGNLTEIKDAEEPVEVEVELESELDEDIEEGKVTMKKMEEAEIKIEEMGYKIKALEEVVDEMMKAYGKMKDYSVALEGKLENFIKSAPAEDFKSFKSEFKPNKEERKSALDTKLGSFREIRTKK